MAGDSVTLDISIRSNAKLALVTQGSMKLFKAPNRDIVSRQNLNVQIPEDGALCYLPDPVQPFNESIFEQKQIFHINYSKASICVLDWLSEGRTARGEKWGLWGWKGKNEVWRIASPLIRERLLLRDYMILEGDRMRGTTIPLHEQMDGLGVFGTLILYGPVFSHLMQYFLDEFTALPRIGGRNWTTINEEPKLSPLEAKRASRRAQEKQDGVLWTAAATRGFVLVKFGAEAVEGARIWLGGMLRDEGTVEVEFGEGALLCMK